MLMRLFTVAAVAAVAIGSPAADLNKRHASIQSRAIEDCPGYTASNVATTDSTLTADLRLAGTACNVYGDDIADLKLLVEYQTDSRLHVKIFDKDLNVYQVQESVLPRSPNNNVVASSAKLQFSVVERPFSFKVTRKDSGETIFDTSESQLIFESQYVRIRTKLPANPNLYGLGEHSDNFRLGTDGYQRTMWNSESPFIPREKNLYGSHPVYMEHRGNAGTHAVFLLNSNGMDININQTTLGHALEYNTIGGVLDFYFLAGPSPAEVSKQYAEVVGLPAMMPYWTFGFHQCKYGWWDVNWAAEVVGNYSKANIPLEVLWGDIDYMDLRQDFTVDPERFPLWKMRELVQTLHQRGQKYVMMLDPGIHRDGNYSTFVRGDEKKVFLQAADGSNFRGVQWAGEVVWPDWLAPQTQEWWTGEILRFFDPETGIDIDGAWNDMNEASNFCENVECQPDQKAIRDNIPPHPTTVPRPNTGRPIEGFPPSFQPGSKCRRHVKRQVSGQMKGLPNRELFEPPYRINNHRGELSDFTIHTNITNIDGTVQYDTHNLYGTTMAYTSYNSLVTRRPGKRPFVLTRSSFAGAGRRVAHWFGDNYSAWDDYRISIKQMLAFATVHAMPMVGSDVCGFNGDAQEKMCARWALLGAFQPFYRNHADISAPDQEFYRWELVTKAAQKAIATRYQLLDYIYTAMYRATESGQPIVEPLWFRYPGDETTFGNDFQWFLGSALLVSPVVEDDSTSVTFYLPDDQFYDFWTHEPVRGTGSTLTRDDVDWTDIPLHIRGGTIIPLRSESANTTAQLRKKDFILVVAPGLDGKAEGSLYLDDGESLDSGSQKSDIHFRWDGKTLVTSGEFGFSTENAIKEAIVLGQNDAGSEGTYDAAAKTITFKGPWQLTGAARIPSQSHN